MSEWISVKDRLPKENEEVLAFSGFIFYALNVNHLYENGFFDLVEEIVYQNVTHWMPLPNPPEEK